MGKRKPVELFLVSNTEEEGHIIECTSEDSRWIHSKGRELTQKNGNEHIVLKPVATYSVKINKKRHR